MNTAGRGLISDLWLAAESCIKTTYSPLTTVKLSIIIITNKATIPTNNQLFHSIPFINCKVCFHFFPSDHKKMKLSTFAAAAFCLSGGLAAPTRTQTTTLNIVARNTTEKSSTESAYTSTLSTATSTATAFSTTQTIHPDLQVRYSSKTPKVEAKHSNSGHLLNSQWEQVTTAVHFTVPDSAVGKSCRLVFRMTGDDGIDGNPAMDVYKLSGCLNGGYTYETRLSRDVAVGHIKAVKGQESEWPSVDMSGESKQTEILIGSAPHFACQPGEYSFEMAALPGGNIGWTSTRGGLSIEICG